MLVFRLVSRVNSIRLNSREYGGNIYSLVFEINIKVVVVGERM